ncbi:carbohydrate esterase family 4 protein [Hymenopellis radicata]|nr:carbohydrate esterase family 4 protein [Hymenopellis radicata]
MFIPIELLSLAFFIWQAKAAPSPLALDDTVTASVIRSCRVPNTAAITFDDGPYIYMNDIIKTLKDADAKATFFFNGNNFDCIYNSAAAARVKLAFDNKHQVASHTWRHAHLSQLSEPDLRAEFSRTEDALKKITGAQVAMTRPPFGEYNPLVLKVAGDRGQTLVNWDFDSGDSAGASKTKSMQEYEAVAKRRPNNILALNHETYEGTAHTVLPKAISALKSAGYRLVTVAECLGQPAYKGTPGAPSPRDSSWRC